MRSHAVRVHSALQPNPGILHLAEPQDRLPCLPLLDLWPARDDRQVLLRHTTAGHGHRADPGRPGILGHKHNAAGLTVETVDQGDLTASGDFIGKQLLEAIPECHRITRLARMNE